MKQATTMVAKAIKKLEENSFTTSKVIKGVESRVAIQNYKLTSSQINHPLPKPSTQQQFDSYSLFQNMKIYRHIILSLNSLKRDTVTSLHAD